jgi:hypothetical protein
MMRTGTVEDINHGKLMSKEIFPLSARFYANN